ncbi:MAG: hypothetical protein LAO76_10200 [Acidobacteriia bacterium]|nr:hypothetical protein [Terriglobia bacterium]
MFFHLIPLYSRIMFIGITAIECFLAIMLLRWDAWKRYPVMSAYLTWQGVGGLVGFLLGCFGAVMPWYYINHGVMIVLHLTAFAVALELYYKIFDPRIGLFAWGRRHVVIIISVSVAIAVMIGSLWSARNGGSLNRTVVTVEEVLKVALWATFCTLWIYSRALGFIWRPRVAGIARGFIFILTASAICVFISMRFSLSTALIANQVEMAAEFLTVAWWLGVFWGEEKFPDKTVSAQVEEFPQAISSAQVEEIPNQYGAGAIARML